MHVGDTKKVLLHGCHAMGLDITFFAGDYPMESFEAWFVEVRAVLASINMPADEWQKLWHFDFRREYESGACPHYRGGKG
jgi:hypothetical protein